MAADGRAPAEAPLNHDHDYGARRGPRGRDGDGRSFGEDHGHSHGLVHESIKHSRDGIRAVLLALSILGLTAIAQAVVFSLSGSVALLADLIHNFGDALMAIPLGIAFLLRSESAERGAGLFVVAAIFISAVVGGVEAVLRLIDPAPLDHLWTLAGAGVIGYVGNVIAAKVRTRAGERLNSSALIADAITPALMPTCRWPSSPPLLSSHSACPSPTHSSAWPSRSSSCASVGSRGRP